MDVRLDHADNTLITIGGKQIVVRRGQTVTLTQPEWDALGGDRQALFEVLGLEDELSTRMDDLEAELDSDATDDAAEASARAAADVSESSARSAADTAEASARQAAVTAEAAARLAMPRGRLVTAERITDWTSANNALGNATLVANRIVGLVATVVGTGREMEVRFFCGGARAAVANNYVGAVLLKDGVVIQTGTVLGPSTGVGQILVLEKSIVVPNGVETTFEVGTYSQAGTGVWVGGSTYPMRLAVTEV